MSRRETEDEFDRQIVENSDRETAADADAGRLGTGADLAIVFDPDLGLMSFQAQMALAILASRRQLQENGGYGNVNGDEGPGVTEEAKEKWKRYKWGMDSAEETHELAMTRSSSLAAINRSTSNDYGSLPSDESLDNLEEG